MESTKECPMCASRNISFSEREHSLVCRDCGSVIAGTPVALPILREEAREVIHEATMKFREVPKKAKAAKKPAKKVKKVLKKKAKKKITKVKKAKKPAKKGFMRRLLRH